MQGFLKEIFFILPSAKFYSKTEAGRLFSKLYSSEVVEGEDCNGSFHLRLYVPALERTGRGWQSF